MKRSLWPLLHWVVIMLMLIIHFQYSSFTRTEVLLCYSIAAFSSVKDLRTTTHQHTDYFKNCTMIGCSVSLRDAHYCVSLVTFRKVYGKSHSPQVDLTSHTSLAPLSSSLSTQIQTKYPPTVHTGPNVHSNPMLIWKVCQILLKKNCCFTFSSPLHLCP